jgi:hypothetical protein
LTQAFHTQLQWVLVDRGRLLQTAQILRLLVPPLLAVVEAVTEILPLGNLVLAVALVAVVVTQTKVEEQGL